MNEVLPILVITSVMLLIAVLLVGIWITIQEAKIEDKKNRLIDLLLKKLKVRDENKTNSCP